MSKYLTGDDRTFFKQNKMKYTDPEQVYAEESNNANSNLDAYSRIEREVLDAEQHVGDTYDYDNNSNPRGLNPSDKKGGYLVAPGGIHGGFWPAAIGQIAAMLLPIIMGSGKGNSKGSTKMKLIYTINPPNHTSAQSFFNSIHRDISDQHPDKVPVINKKFEKLFAGKGFHKFIRQKRGGSIPQELHMGHLLAPLLSNHIHNALARGKNKHDPSVIKRLMEIAEDHPDMSKPVTHENLVRGGSVMSSLWGGLKRILGSLASNKSLKNIGSRAVEGLSKGADKVLPGLLEKGAEALGSYATKKITGEEPEISEEKLARQQSSEISKLKRAAELKKLKKKLKREEESESESDEDRPEFGSESDEESPPELPSGRSNTRLRKELVKKRQSSKAVIPSIPSTPSTTRRVKTGSITKQPTHVPYDPLIMGYRGVGFTDKKKACQGGSWVVKLQQK